MVVILDEIEYCSSGGGKQKTEEAGEQPWPGCFAITGTILHSGRIFRRKRRCFRSITRIRISCRV